MARHGTLDRLHVSHLDPLSLDGVLPAVVGLNASADVAGLVRLLATLVPSVEFVARLPLQGCLAVMRDLGFVLGSVKRFGVEPVCAVPAVEPVLLHIGTRTGMIPRDTILHYADWNPAGARQRTYTGDAMERALVSSVRMTLQPLTEAVVLCARLRRLDVAEPAFAAAVDALAAKVRSLEHAIRFTRENVTPRFFAQVLRPYFEAVRVNGTDHLGPAAAHVPLYLVDLALWASDRGTTSYSDLWRDSARCGLPQWQVLAAEWSAGPSLVGRVMSALSLARRSQAPPQLHASAAALCGVLRALLAFRGGHLRIAREAYLEDVRMFPLGSGGGSVRLLRDIAQLTSQNAKALASLPSSDPTTGQAVASGDGDRVFDRQSAVL